MNVIERRGFLGGAVGAVSSMMLLSLGFQKSNAEAVPSAPGFKLSLLATSWGLTGSFDDYCARVRAAGYDGIEMGWPDDAHYRDEVFTALAKHELAVAFICIVLRPDGGFDKHLTAFAKLVENAARLSPRRPLYLDCHSGRDYYSFEQNEIFYQRAKKVADWSGLNVLHETHRARMLYAPAVAREYLQRIPEMRVALDLSHWCVVSESLLEDQADTVEMALARTHAISVRVGHAQGPQVSDPRAPEWRPAVAAHIAWWDKAVAYRKLRGEPIAMTTEFGPAESDYMPTLPYSHKPVADQWAINLHMLQLLRQRYAA